MKQAWFVVGLGSDRYGLPPSQVDEVVRAARLLRIPEAPPALLGALVLHDASIPVLDLRARLGVPARPLEPRQFFVIGSVAGKRAALVVDQVEGFVELEMDAAPGGELARPPYATGVASDAAGCAVLLVDHVLSTREASDITLAMTMADRVATPSPS